MRVVDAMFEVLRDEGVDRVFGNPGTTELPFVDALGELPYVLAPHEGPVVAMADGYARATRRPAFVSLHVAAGLANGLIGMLNALRSRTPLVVTAGQQDSRHLAQDPMLTGNLVGLATPAAKWATEVHRAADLPLLLRRAFRAAMTPPQGPVFVGVPMDLLGEAYPGPVPARSRVVGPAGADPAAAVPLLAGAERPAIVAGDGVGRSAGVPALVEVATTLGATVYHAPMHDRLNFPMDHPLHAGMLAPDNRSIRRALDQHDVVLLAGLSGFAPHHYSPEAAVGPGTRLVQVDDDPAQLGRVYPAEVGLVGDVAATLAALAAALAAAVGDRRPSGPGRSAAAVPAPDGVPLDPAIAAATLADALPPRAVLVEEAITVGLLLRERLRLSEPDSFQHTVGGGLGWGIGAAVGISLARPDRPVLAALGDGCALFGVHGLWTAAREQRPVTFVVFANGEYRTLKQTLTRVRDGAPGSFPGMDLRRPGVAWPELSAALGVPGVRVTGADELATVLAGRADADGPLLVEVPVAPFGSAGGDGARQHAGRRPNGRSQPPRV